MLRIIYILKNTEWEAIFWLIGLIYLALIDPYSPQHYTLCPFNNIGIENCPGCGLGRSIGLLYHFDFTASFEAHYLGAVALMLITARIIKLILRTINNFKKSELIWLTYTN
ncbi:DUF2752 domain-containing protein [Melioribacter sp. OK-6-Me]|uniref:DUF2752 domain-containing protein n=1 Tax=unclassified Melioribacter TaxID=2627329 RepID=UPI003EDACB16